MKITMENLLNMDENEFDKEVKLESTFTGSGRVFTNKFTYDNDLFYTLEKRFPDSGIENAIDHKDESFIDYITKCNPNDISVRNALAYYKAYSMYPQIKIIANSKYNFLLYNALGFSNYYYYYYAHTKLDLTFIKRNFKNGNNISEVLQIPNYAIEKLKLNYSTTLSDWNCIRIAFKKYIISEKDLDDMITLCAGDVVQFIKKSNTLLRSGYYTVNTLLKSLNNYIEKQGFYVYDALEFLREYIDNCKAGGVIPDIMPDNLYAELLKSRKIRYGVLSDYKKHIFSESINGLPNLNYSGLNYSFRIPKNIECVINASRVLRNSSALLLNNIDFDETFMAILYKNDNTTKPIAVVCFSKECNLINYLSEYDNTEMSIDIYAAICEYQEYCGSRISKSIANIA